MLQYKVAPRATLLNKVEKFLSRHQNELNFSPISSQDFNVYQLVLVI